MCDFCSFEYGVSKMQIQKVELNKMFTWEIRPNTIGQHLLLMRVLESEKLDNMVGKSTIFIKYCPLCGEELRG